jgi:pimeloyl-ACP methyl ester carboxylesterase
MSKIAKAYFLSGLGADHRFFKKQIENNILLQILPWLIPKGNESLESYAGRMVNQIPEDDKKIILGGVSFGGIIALEMAKLIHTEKIILISSVKTASELPLHVKIWRYFPVYNLLGGEFMKYAGITFRYFFGRMPSEEKITFIRMVKDSNPLFIKWAAGKICNWKNKDIPRNIIHLHGSSDLIFPFKNIRQPVTKIEKGTHIMILTSFEKINEKLKEALVINQRYDD